MFWVGNVSVLPPNCVLSQFCFSRACVQVCTCTNKSCSPHMKVRWQPSGVSSLHPPRRFWDWTLITLLWGKHRYLLSYFGSLSVVCMLGSSCGAPPPFPPSQGVPTRHDTTRLHTRLEGFSLEFRMGSEGPLGVSAGSWGFSKDLSVTASCFSQRPPPPI